MLLQNISTYLRNDSYNINISQNNIYINNYTKVNNISDNNISIIVDNSLLIIKGNNFKITKILNNEILFNGQINTIEITYLK